MGRGVAGLVMGHGAVVTLLEPWAYGYDCLHGWI